MLYIFANLPLGQFDRPSMLCCPVRRRQPQRKIIFPNHMFIIQTNVFYLELYFCHVARLENPWLLWDVLVAFVIMSHKDECPSFIACLHRLTTHNCYIIYRLISLLPVCSTSRLLSRGRKAWDRQLVMFVPLTCLSKEVHHRHTVAGIPQSICISLHRSPWT